MGTSTKKAVLAGKTAKKYEMIKQVCYFTGKCKVVGFIDGTKKTRLYASVTALLNDNTQFKRAMNNGTLKISKVTSTKR